MTMVQTDCTRRNFLKSVGVGALSVAVLGVPAARAKRPRQPNIMVVIADDMSWHDCEPYGSKQVRTPNMQRLADEGIRLDRMFTTTAMCAPTRQQLYTGMYPVRSGAYPNHSRVYDGVTSLPHYLKDLGYRVGLIGKTHIKPPASYPFEYIAGGKGGASNTKAIAEFVNRDKGEPYCLVVASNEPHGPWNKGDQASYKADELTVPPCLVDNAVTRAELVKYFAEITFLDAQLGACMKIIEESGSKADTITIFTSEQGSSFPFGGKWTCYETGLKTAFIVRWPRRVKAGSSSKAMTQYVDLTPTLVEAAGGDPKALKTGRADTRGYQGFDGRSFLGVLLGKTKKHRDYVYGAHTTRGIINGSDCYPIRSVRSDRYKLILNLNHTTTFTNAVSKDGPDTVLGSWMVTGRTDKAAAERARFYQHRPAEELYDLAKDPWELKNLADDAAYAKIKGKLRGRLAEWMSQQGDEGNATEMKAKERQGRGQGQPKAGDKKKARQNTRVRQR